MDNYKIESERERYRVSKGDLKYFFFHFAISVIVTIVVFITHREFLMSWSILFFFLFGVPFFFLEIKTFWVTKVRKRKYSLMIAQESDRKAYKELILIFANDSGSSMLSEKYDICKQFTLDLKYALDDLHELKRFAVRTRHHGVINIKISKDGVVEGILVRRSESVRREKQKKIDPTS